MKLFIVMLLTLLTIQTQAADFTISISGGSAGGPSWYSASGQKVGDYLTLSNMSYIVFADGKHLMINPTTGNANGGGYGLNTDGNIGSKYCVYASSDCSGSCYVITSASSLAPKNLIMPSPNNTFSSISGSEQNESITVLSRYLGGSCSQVNWPGTSVIKLQSYTPPVSFPISAPMYLGK